MKQTRFLLVFTLSTLSLYTYAGDSQKDERLVSNEYKKSLLIAALGKKKTEEKNACCLHICPNNLYDTMKLSIEHRSGLIQKIDGTHGFIFSEEGSKIPELSFSYCEEEKSSHEKDIFLPTSPYIFNGFNIIFPTFHSIVHFTGMSMMPQKEDTVLLDFNKKNNYELYLLDPIFDDKGEINNPTQKTLIGIKTTYKPVQHQIQINRDSRTTTLHIMGASVPVNLAIKTTDNNNNKGTVLIRIPANLPFPCKIDKPIGTLKLDTIKMSYTHEPDDTGSTTTTFTDQPELGHNTLLNLTFNPKIFVTNIIGDPLLASHRLSTKENKWEEKYVGDIEHYSLETYSREQANT